MKIFTIGFTQKTAEEFFKLLIGAGVKTVVDIRLHNTSQLAGFAKRDDLRYFLARLGDIGYRQEPLLAPTGDILDGYKKKLISWEQYEARFASLMRERGVEAMLNTVAYNRACLLCSEHQPEHCHRRLVADYLSEHWGDIEILHLV